MSPITLLGQRTASQGICMPSSPPNPGAGSSRDAQTDGGVGEPWQLCLLHRQRSFNRECGQPSFSPAEGHTSSVGQIGVIENCVVCCSLLRGQTSVAIVLASAREHATWTVLMCGGRLPLAAGSSHIQAAVAPLPGCQESTAAAAGDTSSVRCLAVIVLGAVVLCPGINQLTPSFWKVP